MSKIHYNADIMTYTDTLSVNNEWHSH